nr:BspA family leucine-rich repeat surface protein [Mycoplasmopsis bovis]
MRWNVSKVTQHVWNVLFGAKKFNQDLNKWMNVSNVTNMERMFQRSKKF